MVSLLPTDTEIQGFQSLDDVREWAGLPAAIWTAFSTGWWYLEQYPYGCGSPTHSLARPYARCADCRHWGPRWPSPECRGVNPGWVVVESLQKDLWIGRSGPFSRSSSATNRHRPCCTSTGGKESQSIYCDRPAGRHRDQPAQSQRHRSVLPQPHRNHGRRTQSGCRAFPRTDCSIKGSRGSSRRSSICRFQPLHTIWQAHAKTDAHKVMGVPARRHFQNCRHTGSKQFFCLGWVLESVPCRLVHVEASATGAVNTEASGDTQR